jgi:signal transduction histidine kinase
MSVNPTTGAIPSENQSIAEEKSSARNSGNSPKKLLTKWFRIPEAMPDSQLSTELQWLVNIERTAVIPSKWMLLALSIVLSVIESGFIYPPARIFTVLAFYAASNLVFSYVYYFHRYAAYQIRQLEYLSIAMDIVVVTLLIFLTGIMETGRALQTDYYLLYFLIILRGIVLFPTKVHSIVMNGIISVLYIFTVFVSQQSLRFLSTNDFLVRLVLLWGVMLMSWFVLEIVRIQRERIQEDVNRIRQMEDQLIRNERLASMGEIAASVAHEINNPVGIITACTDYLLRKTKPQDPQYENLKIIATEAERCKRIVAELLNLASPSKIKTEPLSPSQLIQDTVTIVRPQADQHQVTIQVDCQEKLPEIQGNSTLLQRALVNLYSNAIQAMPQGGNLSIQAQYEPKENCVSIHVTDNGVGIPPEDMDKIFTPFFTTRAGRSGLGLAITDRIIDWHNGHIYVQSQPEKGTEFGILLPVKTDTGYTL